MARRKRRDEDAVDERLDQDTDEARDEAAEDPSDDALDTTDADSDDDLEAEPARGGGGVAVKRAKADADTEAKVQTRDRDADTSKRTGRGGPFARVGRFLREVVAEMRKVIWPTRKELLTYTVVVVFFVAVMLSIIGLLDVAFARAMLWVFGSNTVEE